MAHSQLRLFWVIAMCFFFVGCANGARGQKTNHMISKQHREKKAHLVKKYLKRLKKPEGLVKLVDGRGDYEGMLMETSLYYSARKKRPHVSHYFLIQQAANYFICNSLFDAMFTVINTNTASIFHDQNHHIGIYRSKQHVCIYYKMNILNI